MKLPKSYDSVTQREHPSVQTIIIAGAATQVVELNNSYQRITKRGERNPNYALDLATGNIPKSLPLFYEYIDRQPWLGTLHFVNRFQWWYPPYDWDIRTDMWILGCVEGFFHDPYLAPPTSTAFDRSQAEEEAVQTLLSRIKDMKVNMAQVLAEATQTASLIQTTAFRIADFIALLRQKKLRQACKVIGVSPSRGLRRRFGRAWEDSPSHAVGNAFIELHFGWKPLISDIEGFAEQLAMTSEGTSSEILKRRASAVRTSSKINTWDDTRGVIVSRDNVSFKVSVGCTFKSTDAMNHTTASLGLQNPLALLEELTPFSFVIDWLVDIGGVLSNLDATFGLAFLDGWMTTTEVITQSLSFVAHNEDYSDKKLRTGSASRTYKLVRVSRQPLSEFPSSYIPVISNPLSMKHIGLSLGLIRQRI